MFTTINDVRDFFLECLGDAETDDEYDAAERWIRSRRFESGKRYEDITREEVGAWAGEYLANQEGAQS